MLSNSFVRQAPVGVIAILAILGGTIVAQQVVPASRTPEKPAPRPVNPNPATSDALSAAPATTHGSRLQEQNERMDELVAAALDQKTDLNINDTPIREAFDLLASQTGIKIEVERGTVGLLPEGSGTKLKAIVKGRPLRETLTALLLPIALQFDVENGLLIIRATPPLRRCVTRCTWDELELLEMLATKPWSDELANSLKFQFQDASSAATDVNRAMLLRLAREVGQGTAAQVLEHATDRYGWTWYPSHDLIVVLPKTRQIERQLQKRVSDNYSGSLQDTLWDLAATARVPLRIDPGAIASLPPFTVSVQNTPIRQVLEIIAGQTGLGYFIESDGVRITANPLTTAGSATRPASDLNDPTVQQLYERLRNSVVGEMTIPGPNGAQISIWLRENDLPPGLGEMLKARKSEAAKELQAFLTATTRPAQ